MPLIKVQTSVAAPDQSSVESMLKDLSSSLAAHGWGKLSPMFMTAFEADVPMTFAGTTDPVCYHRIKSVGTMGGTKTKAMSCRTSVPKLKRPWGFPKNRTYIEFADAAGADVGLERLDLWLIFDGLQ